MKNSIWKLRLLWAAIAVWLLVAVGNQFSSPTSTLGLTNGKLATCPDSPNCVCSCIPETNEHYIAPIAYQGSATEAIKNARQALEQLPGISIVIEENSYLRATATTRLLRFVDDVEIIVDESSGQLHFRSASRVGRSDLGVNRARLETFRTNFERLQGQ